MSVVDLIAHVCGFRNRICTIGAAMESRFVGCMLGVAVGDALGMVVEGMRPRQIRQLYGTLRDFQPERFGAGRYTDDTQLTLVVAESLLACRGLDPEDLGRRIAEWLPEARGAGAACTQAALRLRSGSSWYESGVHSAGCGSAMRVAPIGLYRHGNLEVLKAEAITSSLITHTDPRALAGAVAAACGVALLVSRSGPLDPRAWLAEIEEHVSEVDGEFAAAVGRARECLSLTLADALGQIGTGGFVLETVPAALLLFARFPDDLEGAVVAAVNAGGDTDSVAAIVGSFSGAYNGANAIPHRWLAGLENASLIADQAKALYRMSSEC